MAATAAAAARITCLGVSEAEAPAPSHLLRLASRVDAVREGAFGSSWFAHHGPDDTVCHVEIRRPYYKGSVRGGSKSLFRLRSSHGNPCRIVITKAPIDALSLAALEELRADTLCAGTRGGIGPGTIGAVKAALRAVAVSSDARLIAATDANLAGDHYAAQLAGIANALGVPAERSRPEIGEDWRTAMIDRD